MIFSNLINNKIDDIFQLVMEMVGHVKSSCSSCFLLLFIIMSTTATNTVNYQLYRTNTKLGGQMKWDLVLDSGTDELYVKDFHLTPISDSVPFNKYSAENLLNYSHQYNVQVLYKDIKGYFYDNRIKPAMSHNWPIVVEDDEAKKGVDSHDGSLEMGLRRAKYQTYHKQFEFLVPVWLEDLNGNQLAFEISIKDNLGNLISTRYLDVMSTESSNAYHNKFAGYLTDYIHYVGLDVQGTGNKFYHNDEDSLGGGDVINIDLTNSKARITGFNVGNGNVESLYINDLPQNLLYRERPVLEFDNMIIKKFQDNELITRQLFNFNLCFDLEDIATYFIISQMLGKQVSVSVRVCIKDINTETYSELPIRDFYTNYEYIPKQKCVIVGDDENTEAEAPNVFDYLQDYKCPDFISSNKISPCVCHWSLVDYNNYIFNLYDGFGGYYKDNNSSVNSTYNRYGNSPNLTNGAFSYPLNNIGWMPVVHVTPQEYITLTSNNIEWILNGTTITDKHKEDVIELGSSKFINNIKFDNTKYNSSSKVYVFLGYVDDKSVWDNLKDSTNTFKLLGNSTSVGIWLISTKESSIKLISLVAGPKLGGVVDFDSITYKNMMTTLKEYAPDDTEFYKYIQDIYNCFSKYYEPRIYAFTKGLYISSSDNPGNQSNEITYYKNDNMRIEYVERYDGKLRPTFIDPVDQSNIYRNYQYYKQVLNKEQFKDNKDKEGRPYLLYSSSGYEPLYPSLGYYALKSAEMTGDYYNDVGGKYHSVMYGSDIYEYPWYNNGTVINLYDQIEWDSIVIEIGSDGALPTLKNRIIEKLGNMYGIEDENLVEYIYSCYNCKSDYDYSSDEKEDGRTYPKGYKHHVVLTLK